MENEVQPGIFFDGKAGELQFCLVARSGSGYNATPSAYEYARGVYLEAKEMSAAAEGRQRASSAVSANPTLVSGVLMASWQTDFSVEQLYRAHQVLIHFFKFMKAFCPRVEKCNDLQGFEFHLYVFWLLRRGVPGYEVDFAIDVLHAVWSVVTEEFALSVDPLRILERLRGFVED